MRTLQLTFVLLLASILSVAQTARVQVIHNSPDALASTVDVYLNGEILLNDFAFRSATPFIDAPAETNITISVAPSGSESVDDAIADFNYTLTEGEAYVLMATGILDDQSYDPAPGFDLQVFTPAQEEGEAGSVDLIAQHGATDAPGVNIVNAADGQGIFNGLQYPNFSGYQSLPTDDYVLDVQTADGATTVASYIAPLATANLDGGAGVAFASGFLDPSVNNDGPAFGLFVALPDGTVLELEEEPATARVQVIHNSADAAAEMVDVYLNDELLLDDFTFRTSSPFVDAPAGEEITISVAPSTSGSVEDAIASFNFTLAEDETYVLVANGIVSAEGYNPSQEFDIDVYDMGREEATEASNTDLLVHHGSTDAPTVNVYAAGDVNANLVEGISYPEFSDYLELATDDYTIEIQTPDGETTVATYEAPLSSLGLDGAAGVVVASGFLDPSVNSDGPAFGLYVALPGGGDLVALPVVETEPATARVQVIHNSADAAAEMVDVYLNDELLLDDFAFRTSSPFVDAPAGEEITISVAPSTSGSVEDAIASFNFTLAEDETYVLVANGIVSAEGYNPSQEFDIDVYDMGREEATEASNTDLLVHHGSTDAPTVNVYAAGDVNANLVEGISYPEFSDYLELATDDYTIEIQTPDGETTVATYEAPLSSLGLDGAAGVVVASGFLDPSVNSDGPAFGLYVALPGGGDLVALPVVETEPATARVQVIHNSADAAAEMVDVYLNDELLLDDFAFRTSSPFVDAPAGEEITISVAPSTSGSVEDAIASFNFTLAEDETYVLVANGIVSAEGYNPSQEFDIDVYDMGREEATEASNTDLLVHHGSTDAPTVNVYAAGDVNANLVEGISYPEFSDYLELATDDYTIEIQTPDGETTVATYEAPLSSLGLDGAAGVVVASGFLDPSVNSDGPAFGLYVALPDGGDFVELPSVVTSIDNRLTASDMELFPNPASTEVFIESPSAVGSVMVVDAQGKLKRVPQQIQGTSVQLQTSNLSSGIYHAVLDTDRGSVNITFQIVE